MTSEAHPPGVHTAYLTVRFRGPAPAEWPGSFVVITGYATTGERWTPEANAQADARLRTALEAAGVWHQRLTGYSPETGHAEPGWAAELPLEEARELGRRFLQDAIYHIQGDALSVVLCGSEPMADGGRQGRGHTVEMGSFRARLTPGDGSSGPGRTPDPPPAPGG